MKTTDREHFQTIGYYLCEIVEVPEWLHGPDRQMLSVSGCIGKQHPRWECFMGGWLKGESEKYRSRLRMDAETWRDFTESVNRLLMPGVWTWTAGFCNYRMRSIFMKKCLHGFPAVW